MGSSSGTLVLAGRGASSEGVVSGSSSGLVSLSDDVVWLSYWGSSGSGSGIVSFSGGRGAGSITFMTN